ncbi:PREDICTED: PHD finger-like domain-containing protein 5A-like [Elephantulus edwardii]|uniref:PHD finger-like domain-containing protein 5A-like n=1 Tax=Elephantulus edwardii TaxID=28737 RepID=UPI0003F0CF36|nr:PREDICTED: PHD finger-like domain-containing protein 5A-like [Elephantulus edwardii]
MEYFSENRFGEAVFKLNWIWILAEIPMFSSYVLNVCMSFIITPVVFRLPVKVPYGDLISCCKRAGVAIGRLCEKRDGKCVIYESYVCPCTLVCIYDECNYGSYQGRCVICRGPGISDAYYCKECTIQEKDHDGCPKIVKLGSSKTELFYERKKYGFKKR